MNFFKKRLSEKEHITYANKPLNTYNNDEAIYVKTIHKSKVYKCKIDNMWCYFMILNDFIVCYCVLQEYKYGGNISLEIINTYTFEDYRCQGRAYDLYKIIINEDIILISGISQNKFSKGIWIKLVNDETIDTWAVDLMDGHDNHNEYYITTGRYYDDFDDEFGKEDFMSGVDIYSKSTKEDVRICAQKIKK
jgi:hypothetical protein